MDRILSPGRIIIAISLVVFRIQHFLYANFVAPLHDPGPWTSGFEILALCGSALVLAATL